MPSRIEDYALIGDRHTAALVGLDGSIDWLCLPRFDSSACFAALLGTEQNGRWKIAPAGGGKAASRRYRDGSLVLETDFETPEGAATIIDFMPARGRAPAVVRIVVGRRGRVKMESELVLRFDYGSIVPWVRRLPNGLSATAGPEIVRLVSPAEHEGRGMTSVAEFVVEEGQRLAFVLTWSRSYEETPAEVDAEDSLRDSEAFWDEWSGRCTYHGPWKDAVIRSLITLKAMIYAPTGGIVAAATTSLPEKIGGVRNWDYRICWVRDASLSLFALISAGYIEEARAWSDWLRRALAGSPDRLQIMYAIDGARRMPEQELAWLPGYEGSKPVRVGNAASEQFQLDVFGELIGVIYLAREAGLTPSDDVREVGLGVLDFLESHWTDADDGIWEVRGPRRQFTHSKVMAWLAFDRAVKAVEEFGIDGPVERWKAARDAIHHQVCREGFHAQVGAFTQYYGGKNLDASLLMLPLVGFLPPDDPRILGTVAAIERDLLKDGLVTRYGDDQDVDGLPPGEGRFLACSFWLAEVYHLIGRREEAINLFERLLDLRNDVGLLAEEYAPDAGRQVGNFPQAFSHLALIRAAIRLSEGLTRL